MKLPLSDRKNSALVFGNDRHHCLHGTVQRMTAEIVLIFYVTEWRYWYPSVVFFSLDEALYL